MQSVLDWAKLYAEGRCKDIGIPFNEEERNALFVLKIPVDYVRSGIVTLGDYQKALEKETKTGKKDLDKMDMDTLIGMGKDLDVKMTPEITKSSLVRELEQRIAKRKEKVAEVKVEAKAYASAQKETVPAKADEADDKPVK